ncbi:hypothetical protein [Phenylobacterium aquaticum]|uniref:hypothetical protein n=1 Tax=Phenylobacterium aquaticum TaxID=1763816 RepID=UPI001F5C7DCD|nr:hypothetical protein [Phenylobacterium aquaticum]MCI3132626.1 hypothetical protein [Phenylobacterium aquaticum]
MTYAIKWASALTALALLAAPAAQAAPSAMLSTAEKLTLKGKKGESLFRPGYVLGEYTGASGGVASSTRAAGVYAKDKLKADFTVMRPGWSAPVTVTCSGGQSRLGLGWITFKRDTLDYICEFGGTAPAGATFALAMTKGGFLQEMAQPQRAGELQYGGVTLRAQTKFLGGLPMGGGGATSYVFSKGEQEIGGLQLNAFPPAFYLPPQGSADRDAAAILSLILFYFRDPGRQDH